MNHSSGGNFAKLLASLAEQPFCNYMPDTPHQGVIGGYDLSDDGEVTLYDAAGNPICKTQVERLVSTLNGATVCAFPARGKPVVIHTAPTPPTR